MRNQIKKHHRTKTNSYLRFKKKINIMFIAIIMEKFLILNHKILESRKKEPALILAKKEGKKLLQMYLIVLV